MSALCCRHHPIVPSALPQHPDGRYTSRRHYSQRYAHYRPTPVPATRCHTLNLTWDRPSLHPSSSPPEPLSASSPPPCAYRRDVLPRYALLTQTNDTLCPALEPLSASQTQRIARDNTTHASRTFEDGRTRRAPTCDFREVEPTEERTAASAFLCSLHCPRCLAAISRGIGSFLVLHAQRRREHRM